MFSKYIFLFIFTIFCFSFEQIEVLGQSQCVTNEGKKGTCIPFKQCSTKGASIKIKICSYSGSTALVCCPASLNVANRFDNDSDERISDKKCQEYRKIVDRGAAITVGLIPQITTVGDPGCDYTVPLILGGEKAGSGEFPHMAALGYKEPNGDHKYSCGGSLISENFILTAAHCTTTSEGVRPDIVKLGTGITAKSYTIAEIIKHPEYRPKQSKYNDIALIKLVKNVAFSKQIRPACLWTSPSVNETEAIASGYGVTEFGGSDSKDLLKVKLKLFSNDVCQEQYAGDRKLSEGVLDSQLCAGDESGEKDTCQGDSGGPLQVVQKIKRCAFHWIVGITSFGKLCGLENALSIYTRVSSYLNWIEQTVWP